MNKFKQILYNIFLGGFTVVVPVALTAMILVWTKNQILDIIKPLTDILINYGVNNIVSDLFAIIIILIICFFIGLGQRTRLGNFLLNLSEKHIFKRVPGYKIIKEVVGQFLGQNQQNPFKKVALARLFSTETLVTVFIVDETDDRYSVFMPTGPNPTSGNIYHIRKEQAILLENASAEETLKSILACGSGSNKLLKLLDLDKETNG